MKYKLSDFNYNLPGELIATEPASPRDHSRFLVLDKKTGKIEHKHFYDIIDYLNPGDILVVNNSKVIPARLFGYKKSGGKVEVLLHKKINDNIWQCLLGGRISEGLLLSFRPESAPGELGITENQLSFRPSPARGGTSGGIAFVSKEDILYEKKGSLGFADDPLGMTAKVLKNNNDGTWDLEFNKSGAEFMETVERIGQVPLPPYIVKQREKALSFRPSPARGGTSGGIAFASEADSLYEKKGSLGFARDDKEKARDDKEKARDDKEKARDDKEKARDDKEQKGSLGFAQDDKEKARDDKEQKGSLGFARDDKEQKGSLGFANASLGMTNNKDLENYQTVYAADDKKGSVAAPTAGLHFTPELLAKIKNKGVKILEITLYVGMGTFAPIKTENILEHKMHAEWVEISHNVIKELSFRRRPESSAWALNDILGSRVVARDDKEKKAWDDTKSRIIAVGTTSARALEACFNSMSFRPKQSEGRNLLSDKYALRDSSSPLRRFGITKEEGFKKWVDIFIYPGYEFKIVDALITNFHLPKSTLLMLVSALAGKKNIDKAYKEAVKKKYRFYSYGDAMFIK